MFKILLCFVFDTAFAQTAPPSAITIKQILADRDRAVIQFTGGMKEGSEFLSTFPSGKQCVFKVTAFKDQYANIDTSKCAEAKDLVVGQKLEPSLAIEEPPVAPPAVDSTKDEATSASPEVKPTPTPEFAPAQPALIAQPAPALAQPEQSYQRELSDIQLMPLKGRAIVGARYSRTKIENSVRNQTTSLTVVNAEETRAALDYYLSFGLADNLSIGLQFGSVIEHETSYVYGTGSNIPGLHTKTMAKGWIDPTLAMKYRFLERGAAPTIFDLTVAYSPDSGDSELASTIKDGNAKRGGDLLSLQGDIGRKSKRGSFVTTFGANVFGSAKASEPGSLKETADAYTNLFLLVQGQLKSSESVHLRGMIRIDSFSDQKIASPGSDDVIVRSYVQPTIGMDLLFAPAPAFLLQVGARRLLPADIDVEGGTTVKLEQAPEGTILNFTAMFGF